MKGSDVQGLHIGRISSIYAHKKDDNCPIGRTINMNSLKKVATIAVLASAGIVGTAGIAAADEGGYWGHGAPHQDGDNHLNQVGHLPINLLNNVDLSPNLGCLVYLTPPTTAPVTGAATPLTDMLEHTSLNLLANGNTSTEVEDYSCTSNQGSSQAGNNSHHSIGAGSSSNEHSTGTHAGADNSENGKGAGGLLGGTGILGTGL